MYLFKRSAIKQLIIVVSFFLTFLSCDDDDGNDSSTNINIDNKAILSIINQHRDKGTACNGNDQGAVASLEWDDHLAKAALDHSNDMQQNNYFSHQGKNGSSFSERAEDAGFEGFPTGENIAAGHDSEEAVMEGWINSEGHCVNIMNSNATHVGVARSDEGALWTMVLGRK